MIPEELPISLQIPIIWFSFTVLFYLILKIETAYDIEKMLGPPESPDDDVMELSIYENPFGSSPIFCLCSKKQREADELSEILINEGPFEKGYRAYWDGLEVYDVKKEEEDGWWYARTEVEYGFIPKV